MEGRVYVLIFFFWATLTVITPTLVIWSESLKPDLELKGKKTEGANARRMIGYIEKHMRRSSAAPMITEAPAPAPATAPASAPAPAPEVNQPSRTRKLKLGKFSKKQR